MYIIKLMRFDIVIFRSCYQWLWTSYVSKTIRAQEVEIEETELEKSIEYNWCEGDVCVFFFTQ